MRNEWIDHEKTVTSDDPRRIPIKPEPKGPEGFLVLKGGRIFDGTGKPIHDGTVVLERNKIKAILPKESDDWSSEAKIIELGGKTIMPGLIDMHTHLTYTDWNLPVSIALNEADQTLRALERMRYYIECGITSVRDAASSGLVPFRIKEWVSKNRIPGPRVFAAGKFITATGGHAAEMMDQHNFLYGAVIEASGSEQWRNAVREQYSWGADFIKTGSHFSREEIRAAIEEAHNFNLKITSDAETIYIQWAVEEGIDIIEHPLPRTDETIRLMAEKGTEAIPTLIPYEILFKYEGGYYNSTSRRFTFSPRANIKLVKKMKKAGIKMGIGTDIIFQLYRYLPEIYIGELTKFLQLRYSNEEVLALATRVNAEILDMDDKLGTLEPNKLADILIVDGKPDRNLFDLKKVDTVIRDGYIVVKEGRIFIERHPDLTIPGKMEDIK